MHRCCRHRSHKSCCTDTLLFASTQGRNVIIEQAYGSPKITKDGVTVAKAIEFENRYQNVGASLVKQVASATNDVAGDGTLQLLRNNLCTQTYHVRPCRYSNNIHTRSLPHQCTTLLSLQWCTYQIIAKSLTQSSGHAGTTTATVLTRAILSEGCKSVAAGMNPMDLRRGINLAVEHVLADLKGRAKMISTTEEIAQVLSAIKSCSNLEYDN